jgi:hypothetical protein
VAVGLAALDGARREAVEGWVRDKRGNATFLAKGSVYADSAGLMGMESRLVPLEHEFAVKKPSRLRKVTFAEDVVVG